MSQSRLDASPHGRVARGVQPGFPSGFQPGSQRGSAAGGHCLEALEARRLYTATPSLSLSSVGATSTTLSYQDYDGSNLELEVKGPGDGNYHTLSSPYSAGSLSTSSGAHTVTISGLSSHKDYYFRLRADAGEVDAYSTSVDAPTNDASAPNAPTGLSATSSQVDYYETSQFTWTAPSGGADHYVVEMRYDQTQVPREDQWHAVETETSTTSSSDDPFILDPGRTAYYRIRAVSSTGALSAPSNVVSVTAAGSMNTAPTLNSASFSWDSDGSVSASWTFNSSTHGYFLILGFTDGSYQTVGYEDVGGANDTSATISVDDGNFPGDPTELSSVAIASAADFDNEISASPMSNVIYLDNLGSAPAAPANLSAGSYVSGVGIKLLWDNTASNETDYLIQRSSNGGSSFSSIGTVADDVTNYVDSTAASGISYEYRVFAENAGGDSSASNTVSV